MTSSRSGYCRASRAIRALMSTGVMYASTKSFWYPSGSSGGLSPGHAAGAFGLVSPPRLDVAVTSTGFAGSASGSAMWYWYSPASSNRRRGNEPVVPSAVRHVTVISTSGSNTAVVATLVSRNVWPSPVHQYADRNCRVSARWAASVLASADATLRW